jgi:glycosyltransferase involved in cell wall biosynthesis
MLREASILLSPGIPNDYNRLRLPSKLQAYLASGTPTISFATGFGELLRDRTDVLLTRTADPSELAELMIELLDDGDLRATLQRGGPTAARRLFDPATNVAALIAYYRAAVAGAALAAEARADALADPGETAAAAGPQTSAG